MKKSLFVVIALIAVTLSSCKKDKEAEIENTYIGTWKVETITYIPESGEAEVEFDSKESDYDYFTEFTTNNTVNYVEVHKEYNSACSFNVTYKFENNLFKFEDGDFIDYLDKGTLEFKGNNKIVISDSITSNDGTESLVIELTRTDKNIGDIKITCD